MQDSQIISERCQKRIPLGVVYKGESHLVQVYMHVLEEAGDPRGVG